MSMNADGKDLWMRCEMKQVVNNTSTELSLFYFDPSLNKVLAFRSKYKGRSWM